MPSTLATDLKDAVEPRELVQLVLFPCSHVAPQHVETSAEIKIGVDDFTTRDDVRSLCIAQVLPFDYLTLYI